MKEQFSRSQIDAWKAHNTALWQKSEGNNVQAEIYHNIGYAITQSEISRKIRTLFSRSNTQNTIIDIGLHFVEAGKQVPLFERQDGGKKEGSLEYAVK